MKYTGGLIDHRTEKKDFSHLEIGRSTSPTYLTRSKALKVISKYPQRNQKSTSSCFTAHTSVLMADNSYKRIKDVKFNDEIIDADGNPQKVVTKMNKTWQGNLYKVKPFGIEEIEVTPEHPFLTLDGWKEAKRLTSKDYLIIPVNTAVKDKTDFWFEKDLGFLRLYGLFLAEGSVYIRTHTKGSNYAINFTFHEKETEYINFVVDTVKRIWGLKTSICTKKTSKAVNVSFSNKELAYYFKEISGEGCQNKRIHSKFMLSKPEFQLEILKGWLDGDGSDLRPRDIVGVSTSNTLVRQMQNICFRNKIVANIRIEKTPSHKKQVWRFSVAKKYFEERKSRTCDKWRGYFVTDKILVKRIEKITIQKPEKKYAWGVYNLTIENSHTYTANNVAVHNCGAHAGEIALSIDTGFIHEPAFIYKQRKNFPFEGMFHYDLGDIMLKGTCLDKQVKKTEPDFNAFDIKPHLLEASKYPQDAYIVLQNDKFTIDDIAYVVNDLKRPLILFVFWNGKEWSSEYPEAKGELTNLNAQYRHYVTVLPNSAYTRKKQKFVIIQDSSPFGGRHIRHISEDWINKRIYTGLYFTDLIKEEEQTFRHKGYTFTQDLTFGSTEKEVKVLQETLQDMGLFPANIQPTEYFGGITRQAVKDFQKKYEKTILWTIGLKLPTGFWGKSSRQAMNSLLK